MRARRNYSVGFKNIYLKEINYSYLKYLYYKGVDYEVLKGDEKKIDIHHLLHQSFHRHLDGLVQSLI